MAYTKEQIETNVKNWIAALRSGKYSQTEGYLKTDGGYCCLGVACEAALHMSPVPTKKEISEFSSVKMYYEFDGHYDLIPAFAQEALGLNDNEGSFFVRTDDPEYFDEPSSLVEHNDNKGSTFEEIADIIESQPEGLFKMKLNLKN